VSPDTILVTRPEPGGSETAQRLAALGWRAVLAPALVLAPRSVALPAAQAILLTSRAAARAIGAAPRGTPVLAVGEATAEEARRAGFGAVQAADGTAESLTQVAVARLRPADGPVLLAVGEGYALDLARDLRARGFRVLRRVVYGARPAAALPEAAQTALREERVAATLFHSPRSVHCAMSLLREAGLAAQAVRSEALAISPRVAQAAAASAVPLTWRAIRCAARPDQDALIALLGPAPGGAPPAGEK